MQLSWRLTSFSLFTLVVLAGLVKLGLWQTERGAQKQALLDELQRQEEQAPMDLFQILSMPEAKRHGLPLAVTVTLDPNRRVLLDNKIHQGKVGYQLLVPAQHAGVHFLINLGWLPAPINREQWPQLPNLREQQMLVGRIKNPSQLPVLDRQLLFEQRGSVIRSQVEHPVELSQVLGLPLEPWLVLLDEQADWGLVRQWQWLSMGPEKHYGYAVQWYSLALAVLILLLFFYWRSWRAGNSEATTKPTEGNYEQ